VKEKKKERTMESCLEDLSECPNITQHHCQSHELTQHPAMRPGLVFSANSPLNSLTRQHEDHKGVITSSVFVDPSGYFSQFNQPENSGSFISFFLS